MDSSRKTKFAVALVAGLSLWTVHAQAGFYVGGEIGSATIKSDDHFNGQDIDFDESDGAYRVYGGYMFLPFLGAEVSYIDFGSPDKDFNFPGGRIDVEAEATGYTAEALAVLPLVLVDFFAKVGYMSYDIDVDAHVRGFGNFSGGSDGEGPLVGAGVMFNLGPIGVRAEGQYFDVDNVDDLYIFLIGAQYKF